MAAKPHPEGKTGEGIEWQKQAVVAAEDDETRTQLVETLKEYEAKASKKQDAAP